MTDILPLYFENGRSGIVHRGSILAGWTPFYQATLYMIRSEYHNRKRARNDTVFASYMVEGTKTGMTRISLHPHIREWCEQELGYVPEFGSTYLPFDHKDRTMYDRYARDENGHPYAVYQAYFQSDEDRALFQKKWENLAA